MPRYISLPDGGTAEFPDTMTDDQIAGVLQKQYGKPSSVSAAPDNTWTKLSKGYESFRQAIPSYVDPVLDWTPGPRKAAGLPSPGEQVRDVLPRGLTSGLAQTAVGVPGLGPTGRVVAATGIGAGGAAMEGRDPKMGAIREGAPVLGGELLNKVLGPFIGMLPGGKRLANEEDAKRIGGAISEVSPPFKGTRTTQDIRNLAEGGGQKALGEAKEQVTQRVEGMLPGRPGTFLPPGEIPMPSMTPRGTVPFRQANERLSELGRQMSPKRPEIGQEYGVVRKDIVGGLREAGGPPASATWEAGQEVHKRGQKLIDFLMKSGVVDADGMLNVVKMQRLLNAPKNVSILQKYLGPEDFAKLESAITRGAGRGAVDRMAPGTGRPLDALWSLLRRQNTGANMWLPVVTGAVGLPNAGSQYVGRHPLAMPNDAARVLDLLGLKIGDTVNDPTQR